VSAILDALKRQEEERRRGQAATEGAAERLLAQQPRAQKSALGRGLAIALGMLIIGGLTFVLLTAQDSAAPQSAPAIIPPVAPARAPNPEPKPNADAALAAPQARESLAAIVAGWRVSAHIYGELKEDRALWINGKAYGEGDEIDGLTLEAITAEGYRLRRGQESLIRRVTPP
jgi:hypothetical protein